jgi:hypothetical protein
MFSVPVERRDWRQKGAGKMPKKAFTPEQLRMFLGMPPFSQFCQRNSSILSLSAVNFRTHFCAQKSLSKSTMILSRADDGNSSKAVHSDLIACKGW